MQEDHMRNENDNVPAPFLIKAVAFKEGEAWVVQGIEYDIVAHANDIAAIPHAFIRAVLENMLITEHLGRRPLEGIKPAPDHFRSLYEDADLEIRPLKKERQSPDIVVHVNA
jgi:hypothetical protein